MHEQCSFEGTDASSERQEWLKQPFYTQFSKVTKAVEDFARYSFQRASERNGGI